MISVLYVKDAKFLIQRPLQLCSTDERNPYEVIMICYLTMQKNKRESERNVDCIKTNLLTVSSARDKNQAAAEACHMPLPSASHFKCEALSPLLNILNG